MPRYKLTFNLENILPSGVYVETERTLEVTAYVTIKRDLTPSEEAKIKEKMPFVEITKQP